MKNPNVFEPSEVPSLRGCKCLEYFSVVMLTYFTFQKTFYGLVVLDDLSVNSCQLMRYIQTKRLKYVEFRICLH